MAIRKCVCTDKTGYQDKKYGNQMRVKNKCGGENVKYRCTNCGQIDDPSGDKKKK